MLKMLKSVKQIRKISLTEPVEIRRSLRKYLLNTMKNGWLIFGDENGHSLFSGMYLPVQWDVRDVMGGSICFCCRAP